MKYTIELTNKQKAQMDCIIDIVHRYVGFNPKLEPIKATNVEDTNEYQIGYKVGFEDGNKIADKDLKEIQDSTYDVAYNEALKDADHAIDVLKSMTGTECAEWFEDCVGVDEVVCGFTVQRIVEITKAYEEKKKAEIGVGDEVYLLDPNDKSVVTFVDKENRMLVILTIRGKYATLRISDAHKTGRHFGEVEQLLDKLGDENND